MTKLLIRQKALELRKSGESYSRIKSVLGVSKSTLTRWLSNFPLTKEQIDNFRGKSEVRIQKYKQTMQTKREARFSQIYTDEKARLLPITRRELYVLGLFLYWGEGKKVDNYTVSLNNTDPEMIKFFLYWLIHGLGISKKLIKVSLQLYQDMNITQSLDFWSKTIGISIKQFTKPYIKKSKRLDIDQKGFGHGTCGLYVYSAELKYKVNAGIKVLKDYYLQAV